MGSGDTVAVLTPAPVVRAFSSGYRPQMIQILQSR